MSKAIIVALREVRTYLQDKADLAFSLLLPIGIFALMYGAFGGQDLFHGTAYIVNEDGNGKFATMLLERLEALESLDVEQLTPAEADRKLNRSDLRMVVIIPEGFSDSLTAGKTASLVFKQRGNGGDEGQIVASLVRGVVEEIEQELQVQAQVKTLAPSGIPAARIETTVEKFLARDRQSPIVAIKEIPVGNSRPDPVKQFMPGIITMFVLFAVTLTAQTIVEERRKGTLERLLTTRLSTGQLFIGKFLASLGRGFVQTLILLVLAGIVFRVFTPLSFVQAVVIALVFAAAAGVIGLIIGSVARTPDQATWMAVFITMFMTMLGGTFFTVSRGSVLYILGKLSLNTYANDAFKGLIVRGDSLADMGLELGVLIGVVAIGLVLSRVLFRAVPGGR
ncbi:MAG: ABC transporter permease [Chloroflexi bacterium]|nr:ABC transporter permease [Chloroflexota bacterium]